MTSGVQDNLKTKLFLGFHINSEIRMHLNASPGWKQAQAFLAGSEDELNEMRYQDKDYIGTFSAKSQVSIEDIQGFENRVRNTLEKYCPELNVEAFALHVFPQVFLS